MEKNATILSTLEELLKVIDARANVTIFRQLKNGNQEFLRLNKVYNLIADPEFTNEYGSYKIIGLCIALGVANILIEEA